MDKPGIHVDWDQLIHRYDHDNAMEETETSDEETSDTDSMIGLDDEFGRIMEITQKQVVPHKDYITIGLVGKSSPISTIWVIYDIFWYRAGHPNVGKSTIINSVMQRVVVSASRTPGTAHL